jgi:hypothetical protein
MAQRVRWSSRYRRRNSDAEEIESINRQPRRIMLEQFAPVPILVGSLLYAGYLYGTNAGRNQVGMHRAASLTLVLSGLALAFVYWVTTGLGHDRDAAIRFILATILWGGLVITINRRGTAARDVRPPISSMGSRAG